MRNGVVADTLRKAGSPYRIIFGLNFPQLRDIADEFSASPDCADLAKALWDNSSTRESRLLSVMLTTAESLSPEAIEKMVAETDEPELADIVAKRILAPSLLRHPALIDSLSNSPRDIVRYMALRLAYTLVDNDSTRPKALAMARAEIQRQSDVTLQLARQLEYDSDW